MSITHRVKRLLGASLAGAMVFALMPAGVAAADALRADDVDACDLDDYETPTFGESSLGFWADEIECMASYGITRGQDDGRYNSAGEVRRDQMALYIARFLSQAEDGHVDGIPESTEDAFDDIANVHQDARDAINWLAQRGVTTGVTATEYNPGGNVSREQMATYIARAHVALGVGLPAASDEDVFTDTDAISDVHVENVLTLHAAEVLEGDGGIFNPAGDVTRGQMAGFVVRSIAVADAAGAWNGVPVVDEINGEIGPNQTFTDAPELVRATKGNAGVVTFEFDSEIPGIEAEPENFRLYDQFGNVTGADYASISGNTVTVRYGEPEDPDVVTVGNAVRAGVRTGAVADARGLLSIAGDFPLRAEAAQIPLINPNLVSVENYRFADDITGGEQRVLVDFVFDEALPGVIDIAALIDDEEIKPEDFSLIGSQSSEFVGEAVSTASPLVVNRNNAAGTTTVTVAFADDPEDVPRDQLRRGVFQLDSVDVMDVDDDVIWSASFETTSGTTVDPDLVSVEREGSSNVFRFVFDEAVSAATGDLTDTAFHIVDSALQTQSATWTGRSAVTADGARVVRARFGDPGDALTIGVPVHAFVEEGAVLATDSTNSDNNGENRAGSAAITPPTVGDPEPGVTDLLDLVSAERVQDVVTGRYSIRLTFDTDGNDNGVDITQLNQFDINLYNADGVRFGVVGNGGATTEGSNNEILVISSVNDGLTDDRIEATVTVSVQHTDVSDAPPTTDLLVTEGQVDARDLVSE